MDTPSPDHVEAEAFEGLFRQEFAFVWRCARAAGLSDAAAHDVVQEVFLVAHRRLGDLIPGAPVRPWLFGITRRVVWRMRRAEGRRARKHEAFAFSRLPPAMTEEHYTAQDQITRFLATLAVPRRDVFVMSELLGMSAKEIGAGLELRPNTVSWHLREARMALRLFVERTALSLDDVRGEHAPAKHAEHRAWLAWVAARPATGFIGSLTALSSKVAVGLAVVLVPAFTGAVVALWEPSAPIAAERSTPAPHGGAASARNGAKAASPSGPAEPPLPAFPDAIASSATRSGASTEARATALPTRPRAPALERSDDRATDSREAAPPASSRLARELEWIRVMTEAIEAGEADLALAAIAKHQTAYPEGDLADAREVGRIQALCQLGHVREARRHARRFAKAYPQSALRPTIGKECSNHETTRSRGTPD